MGRVAIPGWSCRCSAGTRRQQGARCNGCPSVPGFSWPVSPSPWWRSCSAWPGSRPTSRLVGGPSAAEPSFVRIGRSSELSATERAVGGQLRASLVLTAILTALACVPFVVEWRRPARYSRLWVPWGAVTVHGRHRCRRPGDARLLAKERVHRSLTGAPSQPARLAAALSQARRFVAVPDR
jgi:hypothetical protein